MLKSTRLRLYLLALSAWLVLGMSAAGVMITAQYLQISDRFDQDSRLLTRSITQRLEQHDAILAAIAAMQDMAPTPSSYELTRFAEQIRVRYQHVEGIGSWQRLNEKRPVQTVWRTGAPPIDWPVPRDMLEAALKSHSNGELTVVPAPLNRFALVTQQRSFDDSVIIAALLIDPDRLLRGDELPSRMLGYQLLSPDGKETLSRQAPGLSQSPAISWLTPPRVSFLLTTGSQPFLLEVWRPIHFREMMFDRVAVVIIILGVFVFILARMQEQRHDAKVMAKRHASQLARERMRASATVEATADALITFDRHGRVTLANPAARELAQLTEQVIGRNIRQLLHFSIDGVHGTPFQPLDALKHSMTVQELPDDTLLTLPDGDQCMIEGVLSPLVDDAGKFNGGVLAIRDMGSFRRRTLEALQGAERQLRENEAVLARVTQESSLAEMASGIAHELNQPLTAILSRSQAAMRLLKESPDLDPDFATSLEATVKHAKRAGDIVKRLKSLAMRQCFDEEPFDLHQACRHAIALMNEDLELAKIEIIEDYRATQSIVNGDVIQLEQVVLNIVRNAMEAMIRAKAVNPVIHISTIDDKQSITLRISDNGNGIDSENLPKLFDPFFTTRKDGMGLGLAICQNIISAHGGNLTASNNPDRGACFTISLPGSEEHN
ncbi:PAS domain-containing protein [Leeia sp. TBRC 13508]|uniref:histidine kinase n=1 Tax=Leeia speluncae TaxID=2884804 RepID=A0ABS8DBC0_9NEIS|nr:ATP-binding protein [Leeia speluncae]MCB6185308.1 PAS domain-containing protein [Leeia speluncae]